MLDQRPVFQLETAADGPPQKSPPQNIHFARARRCGLQENVAHKQAQCFMRRKRDIQKNDAAVDEAAKVADRFNEQVRAFNAKDKK